MRTARLEAFSDAVIAIIMTIMVLELKVPHEASIAALAPLIPILLSYVLSFVYLGIYWNNHHHMIHATDRVNGAVLWANLILLFWLSLIPFVTAWMGENHFERIPVALYGVILLMCALSYTLLQTVILRVEGNENTTLADAVGRDRKGKISIVLYSAAILSAMFIDHRIAEALYVVVALIWLVPDRRIEHQLEKEENGETP